MTNDIPEIDILELENEDTPIIIDIRQEYEIENNPYVGTINILMDDILIEPDLYLNKDDTYYILCRSGVRSRYVTSVLNEDGYNAINLSGGIIRYIQQKK